MTDEPEQMPEQQYPSVEPAQTFVVPSYQWMLARVEAADSRIHTLGAFEATVTLAVPALRAAVRPAAPFRSYWFLAALVSAVVAVVIGIIARSRGRVVLPNPRKLYETSLHLSKWEFQRDALYFAGQHFESNKLAVNRKVQAVTVMTALFLLELSLLLAWLARG